MDELKKIPSFQKDHDVLKVGLYESGVSHGVTTWDLRCKAPNAGDYITPKALHSVEHILATLLRNSDRADDIIYFGPMGCRTGFYLLTVDMDRSEVLELLKKCLKRAEGLTEVPGSARSKCGNYLEHDLDGAKSECAAYLDVLENL